MHALAIFYPPAIPPPDIFVCVVSITMEMPAGYRKQVGRVSHLTWRENMGNSLPLSGSLAAYYIVCSQRHNAAMKVSLVFFATV